MTGSQPQRIGEIVTELISRRGYARVQGSAQYALAWREVAGKLAEQTRVGSVSRRTLEVVVGSSLVMQELTFRKQELLAAMQQRFPEAQLNGLRFRVGALE